MLQTMALASCYPVDKYLCHTLKSTDISVHMKRLDILLNESDFFMHALGQLREAICIS